MLSAIGMHVLFYIGEFFSWQSFPNSPNCQIKKFPAIRYLVIAVSYSTLIYLVSAHKPPWQWPTLGVLIATIMSTTSQQSCQLWTCREPAGPTQPHDSGCLVVVALTHHYSVIHLSIAIAVDCTNHEYTPASTVISGKNSIIW